MKVKDLFYKDCILHSAEKRVLFVCFTESLSVKKQKQHSNRRQYPQREENLFDRNLIVILKVTSQ